MNTYIIRIKSDRLGAKAMPIQAPNEDSALRLFCEKVAIKDKELVAYVDDESYNHGLLAELSYCENGPLIASDDIAQEMKRINGSQFDDDLLQFAKKNALDFWKAQPHFADEFINIMRKKRLEPFKRLSPLFSKELYASVLLQFIIDERWYDDFSVERVKDKKIAELLMAKIN